MKVKASELDALFESTFEGPLKKGEFTVRSFIDSRKDDLTDIMVRDWIVKQLAAGKIEEAGHRRYKSRVALAYRVKPPRGGKG